MRSNLIIPLLLLSALPDPYVAGYVTRREPPAGGDGKPPETEEDRLRKLHAQVKEELATAAVAFAPPVSREVLRSAAAEIVAPAPAVVADVAALISKGERALAAERATERAAAMRSRKPKPGKAARRIERNARKSRGWNRLTSRTG